jgi:hypothetical protein
MHRDLLITLYFTVTIAPFVAALPRRSLSSHIYKYTQNLKTQIFYCFRKVAKREYYLRHVSSSVRPHGTTRLPLDGFSWFLSIFLKSVEKIQVALKSDKNSGYFTWIPIQIFDNISFNSSQNEKFVETKFYRQSKHILYSITSFTKSYRLWDNVGKYCRAGQTTDDNISHAHCVLDN